MFSPTVRASLSSVVILCASAAWVQAKPESAETVLDHSLHELMQIAESNKGATPAQLAKKARPLLERLFNFESLTKRAVGPGWRELSAEQQQQAVTLFSEILIRSYAARFDWHNKLDIQFAPPRRRRGRPLRSSRRIPLCGKCRPRALPDGSLRQCLARLRRRRRRRQYGFELSHPV